MQLEPWTQTEIHIKSLALARTLLVFSESLWIRPFCVAKFGHYIKYSQGKCHSVPSPLNLLSHLHTTAPVSKQDLRQCLATRDRGGFLFSVYFGHSLCVLLCIENYNPWTSHFTKYIKDMTHTLLNGGRTPTVTMKTGLSTNLLCKP